MALRHATNASHVSDARAANSWAVIRRFTIRSVTTIATARMAVARVTLASSTTRIAR